MRKNEGAEFIYIDEKGEERTITSGDLIQAVFESQDALFIRIPLIREWGVNLKTMIVFACLEECWEKNKEHPCVSAKGISKRSQISLSTTYRAINKLRKLGVIKKCPKHLAWSVCPEIFSA